MTARLAAWWFAPAPARRLAAMRILVGAFATIYLVAQLMPLWRLPLLPVRSFEPIGVLAGLDAPLGAGLWHGLVIATLVLAVAFTAGAVHRVLAPLFALLLLAVLTYRSSWGMIFHTENLLVIHAAVLAVVPAADAWSWDAGRRHGTRSPEMGEAYGWPLRAMAAATCATYVVAGIAKLRLGGLGWVLGHELRNQVAVDNLRKLLLGSEVSALATPLLEQPSLFVVLAAMTLVVELGAPVALAGGRLAAAWSLAAWGFHLGVVLLMRIVFPYPLLAVAFAPLFAVEKPVASIGRLAARCARRLTGRGSSVAGDH